jgi:MoxR-like ATPase
MLLLKNYVDGRTYKVMVLPNQNDKLSGITCKSENTEVESLLNEIQKYPTGTVFASFEYEMIDDSTIKVLANSYVPLIDNKGNIFKLDSIVEETRTQIIENSIDYYLINNDSIATNLINAYTTMYGIEIDRTARLATLLKESQSALLTTIRTSYPPPTIENDGFYVDKDVWNILIRNALKKESTMLVGHSGCGKTEIIDLVAKALNKTVYHQDMGTIQDTQSALLGVHRIGETGISVFEPAPFVSYIQSGEFINLDELSRSPLSSGNVLFPCLDRRKYLPIDIAGEKDIRKVSVNPETMFFATANIGNEYSGTNAIDRALIDRFMVIELSFPDDTVEKQILLKRTEVSVTDATAISKAVKEIRNAYNNENLSSTVSVRHSIQIASLVADGFSLKLAFNNVIYPLYDKSEREKVDSILMAWT